MLKQIVNQAKNKKFTQLKYILAAIALTTPLYGACENSISDIIPIEQVVKDISYLASDELKGRANFSPERAQAAAYIAERFAEIGLAPMQTKQKQLTQKPHIALFLQHFNVHKIQPQHISVSLNHSAIGHENITMATTLAELSWQTEQAQSHVIGKDDDMRKVLQQLNQQGGQHVVLVNSAHRKTFQLYKNYFDAGLTKLAITQPGAIVLVLSDESQLSHYQVKAQAKISQQSLSNVVGILPGHDAQLANEVVLYSAHYDHLGTTADGRKIYNGADDNASGTTAILNLAQYFAQQGNNQRTLMFSAFSAEEIGGFGSRYFSQQLNPDNVVAMINIEMIGKVSKFGPGTVWMTGIERSNLAQLLNDALPENLANNGLAIQADPYPEQKLFYRSDNATLARLGVPAHSFSSTQLDKDPHYHQVSDDLSSINMSSMHQVIELLAIATQPLVDGSLTPSRIDKSKVRLQGKIY
ncbi:Peptidase family M28 [Colwellia chukchiensis]|uniref:Peptidase family M28 n=1 Tax=Colwellia chukchiensis TaxID=641665 RepID=A0A1H7K5B2_9GAMM|nr:M20/M25/M40 family metallo-hydrolase [Colwellia chukchiensis]SEK82058.1 Peptidase family M28 [Colwellia chukchiensis]